MRLTGGMLGGLEFEHETKASTLGRQRCISHCCVGVEGGMLILFMGDRTGVRGQPPWLADVPTAWSVSRAQCSDSMTRRRIAKSKDDVHGAMPASAP